MRFTCHCQRFRARVRVIGFEWGGEIDLAARSDRTGMSTPIVTIQANLRTQFPHERIYISRKVLRACKLRRKRISTM